jgi:hypothetical protein
METIEKNVFALPRVCGPFKANRSGRRTAKPQSPIFKISLSRQNYCTMTLHFFFASADAFEK